MIQMSQGLQHLIFYLLRLAVVKSCAYCLGMASNGSHRLALVCCGEIMLSPVVRTPYKIVFFTAANGLWSAGSQYMIQLQ